METEQIHQLYESAEEANIDLAIQLAKGQRLGIESIDGFWQQLILDSIWQRMNEWQAHFEKVDFLTYAQILDYTRGAFCLTDDRILRKQEHELKWAFGTEINFYKEPAELKKIQYQKFSKKIRGSLIDAYRALNEIEEGYKDRQTRIDGYFNCYNAALYIPDLTQGLTIDAFDALKHRLKNAFDQQREVNCKACQIAELHAEERCRNRNIWIRNTQIHIDGYWSEQLETYIDGEQLIWINSEAQNEIMDYIGHDSILMKEAAAVLVDNLYINEDDFTLSISNWDNSTNFLIASILNPNKHEN